MNSTTPLNTIKIGVLSDTHAYLNPAVYEFFKDCHQIWHLGDVGDMAVVRQLEAFKPLKAVYGNIDGGELRSILPEHLFFELGGLKILLMHIGGYPPKFNSRSKELIHQYKPNIFACGHSHILKVMYDQAHKMLCLNPGAAGNYGFHSAITFLRFEIANQKPQNLEVFHQDKKIN